MTQTAFRHRMAAHCESGTLAGLLNHAGLDISEAMVFGISAGIFFGYFRTPFLTFPTFVLRNQPGKMRSNLEKHLGVRFRRETFRDPGRAAAALDAKLARGVPVAAQVDYFYMDYLPEYTRAHFNAHYVVVTGKENGRYLVSDAYHPEMGSLDAATLSTARFARGQFAPGGSSSTRSRSRTGSTSPPRSPGASARPASTCSRCPSPFWGRAASGTSPTGWGAGPPMPATRTSSRTR